MADTAQERSEPATPRRREEARKRGQVPKSTDLAAAVVLLGTLLLLYVTRETLMGRLQMFLEHCLGPPGDDATSLDGMMAMLFWAGRATAEMVLPLLVVVFILALATSFGQVGVLFTATPFTPSLNRINPLSGLKRIFSARSVVQLVMGLVKMAVLTLVAWLTLKGRIGELANTSLLSHWSFVEAAAGLLFTLGLRLALALLILAIIDLAYQRWKHDRDLRMTKQEIKEEMRRMDGDPHIKRRRRDVQIQIALQQIRSAVPKADVVVTNPTHYAVAIRYDARAMKAPKVVAKGADFMARRIREIAIEHGVPLVERPPLARALYRAVEVGQEIPAQFYKAVAEILAYVYELAGRGYRRRPMAQYAMN
ncbi:MAG TPA: flagellar biosynthesis protein FlhB [Phycisphaerae bacterium]|nr:flagellar biosynthesis protein FlhB [Phycisphaerae bacterium]